MTNWSDILELLEQGEGQSLEFEKTIPPEEDLARDLVAFSNSDGGRLILGIDDKNKHLTGIDTSLNLSELVKKVGQTRCIPPVTAGVELIEKGPHNIAVITVNEGDEKPYKADGLCYIRDGAGSRSAADKEEQEITSPWSGIDLNKRQKRALEYISEHESISNKEYREMFSISHKTAHIELTMLAEKKILLTQGAGRSTHYTLSSKA